MISNLFSKLTVSHESITTTSQQILDQGKQQPDSIATIWKDWNAHMVTLDKRDRQLAQLYLVNDVLQKSGLQGLPLFAQEVKPYLTPVFQGLQTATDQKFLS